MTTSNPSASSNSSGGIRSTTTEIADATWFDEFTIALRLLAVPGDVIGNAVAIAREFFAVAGTSAEECFGSPKSYAAELGLSTIPQRRAARALTGSGVSHKPEQHDRDRLQGDRNREQASPQRL